MNYNDLDRNSQNQMLEVYKLTKPEHDKRDDLRGLQDRMIPIHIASGYPRKK